MASGQLNVFIRQLRRLVGPDEAAGLTDCHLLERWLHHRDEAAFEVILWRHGPLVLSVCRRLLTDPHDVDDAFQATFLTFVRRAGSIRKRAALASWLYQVAYRVSLRARARRQQRHAREEAGVEWLGAEAESDLVWRDLQPVLDEEIQRLPEKYRATFILCCLQGQTNEEAARALGCPVGTVQSRLSWARERLRQRLTRRGITVSSAVFVTLLARHAVVAAAPAPLMYTTLKAALAYAVQPAAAGVVSASAAALTEGVIRIMLLNQLKVVAAVVLSLGLLSGAGAWAFHGQPAPAEPQVNNNRQTDLQRDEPPATAAPAADEKGERRLVEVASPREGIVVRVATNLKKDEKVSPDHLITEGAGSARVEYRRLKVGDSVKANDVLAKLDDRLAKTEVLIKEARVTAAEADMRAALALQGEAKSRLDSAKVLATRNAISKEDLRAAEVTAERNHAEYLSKVTQVTIAKEELLIAQTVLELYTIRAPVNGVITRIYKHPGEAVKALEPVFQIRLSEKEK